VLPTLPSPILVGRERELVALRECLAAALAGQGSLVLIGGEAGIGKTALAEAFCREAAARGALVLVGRCFDLTETPPYGPWVELLRRYRQSDDMPPLPDAFAQRGTVGEVGSQGALVQQVLDFLIALAAQRPLVLLFDDLHWADPASLNLLRSLARSLPTLPPLILVTYRHDEPTPNPMYRLLPTLVRESAAERIDLTRIEAADIRTLVDARYAIPEVDAARLAAYLDRRSEGNPFFLGELLRTLESERVLRWSAAGWRLGDPADLRVPTLLRQVIDARLARLDEGTRLLLAAAAVIGQEVPLTHWAAVAERDEEALLAAVERAMAAHLVTPARDGTRVQFAHALIREALYEGVPLTRRRLWHRRAGEALAALPDPDPDPVAYHFQQAGDDRAAEWLIRAGERAFALLAWPTAIARLEAALPLLGAGEGRARERAILLFHLSIAVGFVDPQRALAYARESARHAPRGEDPALEARIRFFLGSALCRANDFTAGVPMMRAGLAALPDADRAGGNDMFDLDAPPRRLSGVVVPWLGLAGYTDEVEALAGRHIADLSADAADGRARGALLARMYHGLAAAHVYRGRPDAAQRALEQAGKFSEAAGHYYVVNGIWDRLLCDVVLQYRADRLAEREQITRQFEAAVERAREYLGDTLPPRIPRLPLLAIEGPWDEVPELGRDAIAGVVIGGSSFAAGVAVAQGDRAAMQSLMDMWLHTGVDTPPGSVRYRPATYMQRFAAAQALNEGDLPTAWRWLETHDRWLAWNGTALGRSEGEALWAMYHRAAGDPTAAERHARRAMILASDPRQPLALLAAHRVLGELATDAALFDQAQTHLDAALALADACRARHERALTLLALAALHGATGDRGAATALLDEVRTICVPLHAARPRVPRWPERAGGRRAAPDRLREHESGDRRDALPQCAYGRTPHHQSLPEDRRARARGRDHLRPPQCARARLPPRSPPFPVRIVITPPPPWRISATRRPIAPRSRDANWGFPRMAGARPRRTMGDAGGFVECR